MVVVYILLGILAVLLLYICFLAICSPEKKSAVTKAISSPM